MGIHIATLAPGDKGTTEYTRKEISEIRKAEAAKSSAIIGATYHCLEFEDVYILYDRESINRTTAFMRRIRPSIVFTSSPGIICWTMKLPVCSFKRLVSHWE